MSTFKGVIAEFPGIRIDFFRRQPEIRPPLACFLSHVHSDHLAGLDTLKSPFVYCSLATREILLRLEKYPHRMNFALGILESRKQTYKHLERLLKPIPLETPTKIELEPGNTIIVTLFDANHCPGAVMFLIENGEKSILYTGDVRSEASFVINLCRNPHLIEYTSGLKTLDCIYLDTSNTGSDLTFPSQAEGLRELLDKVKKYPKDTVFHFSAWTYGYEKVWMALSKSLNCQIHIDRYKMRIYKSLVGSSKDGALPSGPSISAEGPILAGFSCGNTKQEGCLTENPDSRIHSCEKGLNCPTIDGNDQVVWITPIIARTADGTEIAEIGVGGGGVDLKQHPELELAREDDIEDFLNLLGVGFDRYSEDLLRSRLLTAIRSSRLTISLSDLGLLELNRNQYEMSLQSLAALVSKSIGKKEKEKSGSATLGTLNLPRRITFPYSRHSSLPELCDLVKAFKPKDVYPCTVDEDNWHEGLGIRIQFGKYCSDKIFRHDFEMRQKLAMHFVRDDSQQTHTTESEEPNSDDDKPSPVATSAVARELRRDSEGKLRLFSVNEPELSNNSRLIEGSLPDDILAKSPGSQSQQLRRKLIVEDLEEKRAVKRARLLQLREPAFSPLEKYSDVSQSLAYDQPERAHLLLEEASPIQGLLSSYLGQNNPGSEFDDERNENSTGQPIGQGHKVERCQHCETECWSAFMGFCGCCAEGTDQTPPYYEIIDDAWTHSCFDVTHNEFADNVADKDLRKRYVGEYLDVDSSAYDSQDGDPKFHEEYEIDSFIDDSLYDDSDGDAEEESRSEDMQDDDTFWEQKFKELQVEHEAAMVELAVLQKEQRVTLRALEEIENRYYDALGGIGASPSNDEDGTDDDEVIIVNPPAPSPLVTELILSNAQDQSQESELTDERIKARLEAFEAAQNEGWHGMSLMSISNNHTEAEIEL